MYVILKFRNCVLRQLEESRVNNIHNIIFPIIYLSNWTEYSILNELFMLEWVIYVNNAIRHICSLLSTK